MVSNDELGAALESNPSLGSIAEIVDFAIAELESCGLAADDARRFGCRVAARLCSEVGGTRYYWPRGMAIERAIRDLHIWSEHDGTVDGKNGIKALAKRHKMTDVHVWRILKAQREARHQRAQARAAAVA
ncbi:Mor transcription activator family protein [uncultured Thiodictyon sp.]|uniref:Mor transcription activator family protein n=1 Tax=uncultured Thiodictyon sp. TaxID=1846217 RepID=UPI0025FF4ED8|nr:Mor transcription activator family protein [uncultured Thiodictyon sp.]